MANSQKELEVLIKLIRSPVFCMKITVKKTKVKSSELCKFKKEFKVRAKK